MRRLPLAALLATPIARITLALVTCLASTANAASAGFNLICQDGGHMRVNGGTACTVAVQEHTWTEIRSLYR